MERIQLSNYAKDITGQKFGRLEALYPIGARYYGKSKAKVIVWKCRCDCGNEIETFCAALTSGHVASCGCSKIGTNTKHGHNTIIGGKSPEYRTWDAMIQRCTNPNQKHFKHYGGRGIKVCARWLYSFENFLHDMGLRPSTRHSLDRINNDGDYCPDNCRWATKMEQASNTRKNRREFAKGKELHVAAWARELGVNPKMISKHLGKGRSMEWIVDFYIAKGGKTNARIITYNGRSLSLMEWSKELGINYGTLQARLNRHSIEEAFTKPYQKRTPK